MSRSCWSLGLALFALVVAVAPARAVDDDSAQRERIVAERAAAEATFAERARDCRERFAVSACLLGAQRDRSAALAKLRRQELLLDEALRKQRAAERIGAIGAKTARPSNEAREIKVRAPRAAESPPSPHLAASAVAIDRKAQEAARKAAFEARHRAAQAHRDAAAQREAERIKKGKAAKPLPAPASAPAP